MIRGDSDRLNQNHRAGLTPRCRICRGHTDYTGCHVGLAWRSPVPVAGPWEGLKRTAWIRRSPRVGTSPGGGGIRLAARPPAGLALSRLTTRHVMT
jgi:hypothetical protein